MSVEGKGIILGEGINAVKGEECVGKISVAKEGVCMKAVGTSFVLGVGVLVVEGESESQMMLKIENEGVLSVKGKRKKMVEV